MDSTQENLRRGKFEFGFIFRPFPWSKHTPNLCPNFHRNVLPHSQVVNEWSMSAFSRGKCKISTENVV